MEIGVVFPQTEIGDEVAPIRRYAERVEELGYTHLMAYDHVLGADPAVHEGWNAPYDIATTFHEPLVLFGFLAAFTSLELVTDVIILPQRQTALVAKQAAQVDVLTGGKFRLGVGLGWNAVEYEALDKDFTNRGRRVNEQIELLRRLWSETTVTFEGAYERVTGAGLKPMPVQRPIPIWLGARLDIAFRRVGRLADGWFPMVPPGPQLDNAKQLIAEAAEGAGRDPAAIGMEGQVPWGDGNIDKVVDKVGEWRDAGATHVAINTMGSKLGGVEGHLDALEEAATALKVLRP